jgi:hypothetical protein
MGKAHVNFKQFGFSPADQARSHLKSYHYLMTHKGVQDGLMLQQVKGEGYLNVYGSDKLV